MTGQKKRPLLENLIESEDLGLEILHPGGLDITKELAELCNIGKDALVLDVASGTGKSACILNKEKAIREGLTGQLKILLKIVRIGGVPGLRGVWGSERIFQSKHTGYGIIAGRKPSIGRPWRNCN